MARKTTRSKTARPTSRAKATAARPEPAGTPREIIMQLHAAAVKALQDEGVRKRFADNGADATPSESPQAFSAFIGAELAKWTKVVRDAGIKPQ